MPKNHLATYLKDHLAGSEAGLEILKHIESKHDGDSVGEIARRIRDEIAGERKVVEHLLDQLDESANVPRRVAGWLSEKALELKLYADDPGDGALRLLEAAEAIKIGVHGKLGMWKALSANAQQVPILATVEYEPLIKQAMAQEELLELVRLEASRAAFVQGG